MNISTTPRRLALAVLTFVCLLTARTAHGQCNDFITAPSSPVNLSLNLVFAGNTQARITNAVLTAAGFVIAGPCSYEFSTDPNFVAPAPSGLPYNFFCGAVGTTQTVYVRVAGGGGPSVPPATRQLLVTVNDNILPTITCPANVNDVSDAGFCTSFQSIAETSVGDNCATNVSVSYTGALGVGTSASPFNASYPIGVTTLTFNVSDNASPTPNTANCQVTVTIADDPAQPPVIICPVNQAVNADANCQWVAAGLGRANADVFDNCASDASLLASLTNNLTGPGNLNGYLFPLGLTNVIYTISDGLNSGNCNFSVTVSDATPPTITCPMNITFNGSAFPICDYTILPGDAALVNATATDNCGSLGAPMNNYGGGTTLVGQTFFQNTTTPVTWMVTDGSGNNSACMFDVTVEDNIAPVISFSPLDGLGPNYGPISAAGCTAAVTVEQPNDLVIDLSIPYIGPNYSFDDCNFTYIARKPNAVIDGFVPIFNPGDPLNRFFTANFPTGTTTIEYEVVDNQNNISTISVTVTVAETTAPIAQCQNVTLFLDVNGNITLNPSQIDNGSSDNCGGVTLSASQTAFTCANLGANLVTLTVTDNSTLSSNCMATVTIVDNIFPILTCPLPKVVAMSAGVCTGTPSGITMGVGNATDPGFYNDNCLGANPVAYKIDAGAFVPGPTGNNAANAGPLSAGVHIITYRVTGQGGNSSTCSFTVEVKDLSGPTVTCPTPLVTAGAGCFATATWPAPTHSDLCSAPSSILSQTHTSGSLFPYGMTTVTYVVKDNVGNTSSCSFVVNVVDSQAPILSCKPNITVNLNTTSPAQPTEVVVSATDIINNVSDNSCFYTISPTSVLYNCSNIGNNNYILTVTDNAMPIPNQTICTTVVKVQDETAPVATCPAGNITLTLVGNSVTLNAASVGSGTDNCASPVTLTIDSPGDMNPAIFGATSIFGCEDAQTTANPTLSHTVTLKVSDNDAASLDATCTRTVIVLDATPPVLTIPANVTLTNYCDLANNPLPALTGTATATDVCTGAIVPTFTDASVGAPVCPDKKIIARTWKATDASGNMIVAIQTITLRDITAPTIGNPPVFPVLEYLPADANCVKIYTLPTAAFATDDCGAVTYSYSIDYPPFGSPDVSGAIGAVSTSLTFVIGQNQFKITATDACGLVTSTTIVVNVADKTKPTINEPFAQVLGNTDNVCGQIFQINNANNNCGNTFTWFRPNVNGAGLPDDDFTDCSAFLANGNGGVTESFTTPPGQGSISVPAFNYNSAANAHPTAFFPVGSTVITYTATDVAGNTATCSFTVQIIDVQAPIPTCPPNQILSTTCPTDLFPDYRNLVNVSDNCNSIVLKSQEAPASQGVALSTLFGPAPVPGQMITVTMKATDLNPNSLMGTCTFKVTLADGSAPVPVVVGQLPNIVSFCSSVIVNAPVANDPCNPNPTIYGTPSSPVGMLIPGSNPPQYNFIYTPAFGNPSNYVVTWIYNDGNGNQSSQLQNITVWRDDFPPVALCKNITVDLSNALNGAANVSILANDVNNGSNDNGPNGCGQVVSLVSVVPNGFGCANIGPNTVTLTVADAANPVNTATCTAIVTVRDVTTPVLNGVPANVTLQSCHDVIPAAVTVTSADNCTAPVVLTEVSTQGATGCAKYSYTITRTWTATDGGNNIAQSAQVLTIHDTKPPIFGAGVANLAVTTETSDANCDASVVLDIASAVTDSCSIASEITITQVYAGPGRVLTVGCNGGGACASGQYAVGVHNLTFTATDICGNASVKTITLTVTDATIPTAVCINGVSAALQVSGSVVVLTSQFNNNSYDNCPGVLDLKIQRLDQMPLASPSDMLTYSCAEADGLTQRPVKLFVTDVSGNMSMCLTYVVIQDNNPPMITCPANLTVVCTANYTATVQGAGVATATDNCPANVTVTMPPTDVLSAGNANACQLITRTWKATDLALNTSTCVQTISITDNIAPTFSATPGNTTITCSDPLVAWEVLTGSDNCGTLVTIDQDTISTQGSAGCAKYSYSETRTWTATDACGNTAQHTQVVSVTDLTAPDFSTAPATVTVLSSSQPLSMDCTVPVEFDIRDFMIECQDSVDVTVLNSITPAVAGIGLGSDISGDFPVDSYTVTFTATDACGNTSTYTMNMIVVDDSAPTPVCIGNLVLPLGTNGEASISPLDVITSVSDNCDIDTLTLSQSIFDCGDLGPQSVTLTATDVNGNSNTCLVLVQVTLGANLGFNLVVTGTPESYLGAENGTATAVATGGSGVFTYVWSAPGGATASLSDLPAGTYTVTVTDTLSGCVFSDTAIVVAGAEITVSVGTGNGCQGAIISIPVTVDNFINVTGFSLGLALGNGAVGAITGLVNVNPALIGLVPGVNSVFWTHPNLTPTTLPNGSVLFDVQIQLSAALVGTTSTIIASALPALVFLQDGVNQAPMVGFNNGSATISCLASADLEIAGQIFTWKAPVKPIPNVTVNLGGTITAMDVTPALPAAPEYSFLVPTGANTLVSASKIATVKNQQINVGDMLGIQAHAALQVAFNNGYQWVAADINSDQRVNLIDYAFVQKYVLGNSPHYTNQMGVQIAPDWRFIDETHIFMPLPPGNPAGPLPNPLNNPIPPSIITHNNVAVDFLSDDFVGVLMGDVNGSVVPAFTSSGGGAESSEVLKFRLDERAVQAGETVTIPFKSHDFSNTQAYQMTIAFDPKVLELQDIQPGVLPGLTLDNFGTVGLNEGLISTLWVGGKPTSFNDNETLFSMTFKALESVPTLSSVLHSSSDVTEAMAIDEIGNSISVDFEFISSVATGEVESKTFALYQNQPNPFTAQTSISFRLPESGRATLRVFSAEGRLVKTVIGDFAEGINAITFQKSDFGSNGVFYYELETPKHSDRKKMILID